jgi:diacylglycerol kinase family enzyme
MQLNVTTDGRVVSGHFLLAVVSNIHLYAGGLAELSPDARLDDGAMDLWLFRGETLGDTAQFAWDLFSGRHKDSDLVEKISFQSLKLESSSPMYVQVDGEPVRVQGLVKIQVYPQALKVLVPENTPHPLFSARPTHSFADEE